MTACGPKAKSAGRVAMSALAPQSGLVVLMASSSPFDPEPTFGLKVAEILEASHTSRLVLARGPEKREYLRQFEFILEFPFFRSLPNESDRSSGRAP